LSDVRVWLLVLGQSTLCKERCTQGVVNNDSGHRCALMAVALAVRVSMGGSHLNLGEPRNSHRRSKIQM
jgi:hypothetical protein